MERISSRKSLHEKKKKFFATRFLTVFKVKNISARETYGQYSQGAQTKLYDSHLFFLSLFLAPNLTPGNLSR